MLRSIVVYICGAVCSLMPVRLMLAVWARSAGRLPAKNYHVFACQDEAFRIFLFHSCTARILRMSKASGGLVRLRQDSATEIWRRSREIAGEFRKSSRLLAELKGHHLLVDRLESSIHSVGAGTGLSASKGELLMFGNLTCNMACPYCLSREAQAEAAAGTAPKLMPLETAHQSIRFIAERMAGRAQNIYINFTLGGEPLLSLERYQHLRDYCAAASEEFGIPVTLNMNTNGTVFTDAFIRYAEQNGVLMAVSIDGPKEIHDSLRTFHSGKGTYDAILKKLPRVLASDSPGLNDAAAGAVLTAKNPYPELVYQHLIELGFRHVVVTPVRDFPHLEWSLNAETVQAFKDGIRSTRSGCWNVWSTRTIGSTRPL
jgi:sulfatase maturation enzyme AslB (radical SAM superfamily)